MLKFILKISSILIISAGICILLINNSLNQNIELNYYKFTGKHQSLIVGSSKARFAINPSFFNPQYDLFNYAFTNATSPYGKLYYNAIETTLKEGGNNNIFILEINPYIVSINTKSHYEFGENKNALGRQWCLNASPNYEYVFRNLTPLYQYINAPDTVLYVQHRNGFNEILDKQTKEKYNRYKQIKITEYEQMNKDYAPSQERLNYFIKTIELLKQQGEVFLVHLPTSKEIAFLEKNYWPNYLKTINKIAKEQRVPFLNLQETFPSPETLDGIHVLAPEAIKISTYIKHYTDSIMNTK